MALLGWVGCLGLVGWECFWGLHEGGGVVDWGHHENVD